MACIFYNMPYVFSQPVKRHDFNEYSAHIERTFFQKKPLSAAPEHAAQQTKVPTQKESAGSRSFSCFQKK